MLLDRLRGENLELNKRMELGSGFYCVFVKRWMDRQKQ